MMRNLRFAIRSLMRLKVYSVINIVGLALTLACVIVIARYVHNETTVDHFNEKLDRICLTVSEQTDNVGRKRFANVKNYNNEAAFVDLREDPAVERTSTFVFLSGDKVMNGGKSYSANLIAADTTFFDILDYRMLSGSNDLSAPDNILITEEFARKLFGKSDPLGQQIIYGGSGKTVTVTGIMASPETKSSIRFDAVLPYSHTEMWSRVGNTLVLLHPHQDYRVFNKKYEDFFEMKSWKNAMRYQLFPLRKVYMDKTVQDYGGGFLRGNPTSVWVLVVVGFLILSVGVINFINIYTAAVLRRGRELGMKKVFGAPGWQVFFQLFVENIILIGIAVLAAMFLTEVFNPFVRNILGFDQLPFRSFDFLLTLGLLVGLPLVTTLFPFFHYNYSLPIVSLRGVGKSGGKFVFREIFLCFQYVLTLGMIIVSLFFFKQLRFMLHADLGFQAKDIIKVSFVSQENDYNAMGKRWDDNQRVMSEVRQAMDESALFTAWAHGMSPVGRLQQTNFRFNEGELKPVNMLQGDERWMKLLGLGLKEGRLFDNEIEDFYTYNIVVTESALPYFGITDIRTEKLQPERRFWYSMDRPKEEMDSNPPNEIVGVLHDFYPDHLGMQSLPIVVLFSKGYMDSPILAAISSGKKQEAIEFMRQLHAEKVGGEFTYSFMEEDLKALYGEDRKVVVIYSVFTFIAILVSVLGLFSMSLFDIRQRYREIAIRKVNGATTRVIFVLLLERYLYLLSISFLIAAPVGWYAIRRYLEEFARKAPVSWWIFAVAFLITAGVSLLTLFWQTRKAATMNPADVVRRE